MDERKDGWEGGRKTGREGRKEEEEMEGGGKDEGGHLERMREEEKRWKMSRGLTLMWL